MMRLDTQAFHLLHRGEVEQAYALAASLPHRWEQDKLTSRLEIYERHALTERIRALWREEYAAGAFSPADELTLDLRAVPIADLRALAERIAARIGSRDPDLPHGWAWVGTWRGQHPEFGETSIYMERAACLKELRRRSRNDPHRLLLARRQQREVDVDSGELFEEEAR